MKICSKCKDEKSESEFYKDGRARDGLQSQCKACYKKYARSDAGKAAQRKYWQGEKGKGARRRYNQSEKGKVAQRRYGKTDRRKKLNQLHAQSEKGKASNRLRSARHRANHPGRIKSRKAIARAVESGSISRARELSCTHCPSQALQYHHPNYANPLDVIPLCRPCHDALLPSR